MITAAQARELTLTSTKAVEALLQKIEPKIIAAAENGQRQLHLYEEGLWNSVKYYRTVAATPLQKRLCEALKLLGFSAVVVAHGEAHAPRALEGDEDAIEHVNHVILVRW